MRAALSSRLLWIGVVAILGGALLPLVASGYVLGLLTVAYYTAVFAMSWDLLFGFAGEVNFGPTFLIGLGAYTAGILDARLSPNISIWLCVAAGAFAAVVGGVVLALPALRLRGPSFGLMTLVALPMLPNFVVVFAAPPGGALGLAVPAGLWSGVAGRLGRLVVGGGVVVRQAAPVGAGFRREGDAVLAARRNCFGHADREAVDAHRWQRDC